MTQSSPLGSLAATTVTPEQQINFFATEPQPP